ncbi:hypothetical protein C7387_1660 [Yokenella regensburgei]|uniref:Uncharacterized protein n=1 Tax=Yokenella regensburgei TaxID=158877 RepID=A0ABX9S292_9ENTR|nr:hypothetical protein C7387_1660 [Yokenella regensburgei]VFS14486.1 Uncharacterised protein [Yokenella regensburgei]
MDNHCNLVKKALMLHLEIDMNNFTLTITIGFRNFDIVNLSGTHYER